jgi:hypothetical protein
MANADKTGRKPGEDFSLSAAAGRADFSLMQGVGEQDGRCNRKHGPRLEEQADNPRHNQGDLDGSGIEFRSCRQRIPPSVGS